MAINYLYLVALIGCYVSEFGLTWSQYRIPNESTFGPSKDSAVHLNVFTLSVNLHLALLLRSHYHLRLTLAWKLLLV